MEIFKQLVAYVLTILFMNWNIIVYSTVVINIFFSPKAANEWLKFRHAHDTLALKLLSRSRKETLLSCLFMFAVGKINLSASTSLLSQLWSELFALIIYKLLQLFPNNHFEVKSAIFYFFSNELFLPLYLPYAHGTHVA